MSNVAGSEIQTVGMGTAQARMEDLRVAIEAAERREARHATADATLDANPCDWPRAGAGEHAPGGEDKLRPEREIRRSARANRLEPADATGRATGEGMSHEPAAAAKSQ